MDLNQNEKKLSEQEQSAQAPAEETQAAQESATLTVEESCRQLARYLESILYNAPQAHLDPAVLCAPCRELGEAMRSFQKLTEELISYSTRLSKGDLSQDFPESDSCLYSGLKNLHANLKHLTWQAGQVTKGDYTQHVSHLGDFSEAFNVMTQQLKEREEQLNAKIQLARRRAAIIQSYTEMLVELLDQRDEWLLVVDIATHEIVHCNKRPPNSAEGGAVCDKCSHRLPIQSKILEKNLSERYHIWEVEESKNICYRIISFPIEWKERPSCIHIVMDVTAEKMSARHLSDERYHDKDTGIRNRLFLEEFMGRVLQEKQDVTVCYLDLEGVKDINTSYGYKTGDAYIQNFADTIRKNFRSGDTFARIKDDKFCLVLSGNVKHLIERKMDEILDSFKKDKDRIFSHRCNFKYSIIEVEGATNELTLDELLEKASSSIKTERKRYDPFAFEDW